MSKILIDRSTLEACPFCGNEPSFSGDASEWKDESRYVELSLGCCVSMTEQIGWRRARDMTHEAKTAELRSRLQLRWNTRAALAEPGQEQAEPDHETRAEIAEQQVVQLAEERDHYLNLWLKAKQAEPVQQGCAHCNHPLYAAVKCRVCGRVTEPVQEPVAQRGAMFRTHPAVELQRSVESAVRPACGVDPAAKAETGSRPAEPVQEPVAWDGTCMLGHCNSPAGCENSGECRAVERAHGIGGEE